MRLHKGAEPVTWTAVWTLMKQTASSWNDINAPRLGAALAFYTMLSIAPLMVICVGIAGLVFGQDAAQGKIAEQLSSLIGAQSAHTVQTLLRHARRPAPGIAAMAIGIFILFFGASGVFSELRDSLNSIWHAKPSDDSGIMSLIKGRIFAFAMVVGVGFLLLVSLLASAAIAAAGAFLSGYLPLNETMLHLINILFSFASVTVMFALLYRVVPEVDIEWRDVWIGAAVTSVLFSLGKLAIGLYLGKAGIGSTYGAAGSLVVFILWVYYSAQIFFVGAEFTHAFAERHGSLARARAEREAAVERWPFRQPRSA